MSIISEGIVRCVSKNIFGDNFLDIGVTHSSSIGRNHVASLANETDLTSYREFVDAKKVRSVCTAPSNNYSADIVWSRNGRPLDTGLYDFKDTTIEIYSSSDIDNVSNEEHVSCGILTKDGFLRSKNFIIKNQKEASLKVHGTNMVNTSVQVKLGSTLRFYCYTEGYPTPTISWLKNNQNISSSERIKISNKSQVLHIDFVVPEDEGTYECKASNAYHTLENFETLDISDKYIWLYAQISLLIIAFLFILVLVILKRYEEKKLEHELEAVGLAYFKKGALESLNPCLPIEDQTDLLPYQKKWEIPFNDIEIGKQLGRGAFGVIFEGKIISENKSVAIKTTNPQSGLECMKYLASELKIMSYLGAHLNVVNLLGACTKKIDKKGLYVILEYCHFGNLQQYLQRHSEEFIDQKNYDTDQFDWTIESDKGKYNMTMLHKYKNSVDANKEFSAVCSKDLLIWCFQTSQGMEFLSSRKIVHGDLAARNILLSENYIAKVSDFGLSKRIYHYGEFVKKQEGPLPVKWMALEAIGKGIFSIQSDVWSFGVVMWEMFSLGEAPYPGIIFDKSFYKELTEGYRMSSPKAATTKVYEIMFKCWNSDLTKRPSFKELREQISYLLENEIAHHYLAMNSNEYMSMSHQQQDYLTMAILPNYENSFLGYLDMSSSVDKK